MEKMVHTILRCNHNIWHIMRLYLLLPHHGTNPIKTFSVLKHPWWSDRHITDCNDGHWKKKKKLKKNSKIKITYCLFFMVSKNGIEVNKICAAWPIRLPHCYYLPLTHADISQLSNPFFHGVNPFWIIAVIAAHIKKWIDTVFKNTV